MSILLWTALGLVVVGALTALIRRPGDLHFWVLFCGAVLALPVMATWLGVEITPFRVVKTVSVTAAGVALAALRRFGARPRLTWGLWVVFIINILEAVAVEPSSGLWMNPLAGALSVLAIATPAHASVVDGRVEWDLGWPFLGVYSLWNITFTYSSGPPDEVPGQWVALGFVHLGVPLAFALRRSAAWAEARVVALFLSMIWLDNVPHASPWVELTFWHNANVVQALQAASLVSAVALLVHAWRSPTDTLMRRLRVKLSG